MSSFFRVSNRTHDGLLFMSKLAGHFDTERSLTVEDAAAGFLSAGYLEQTVSLLRVAGLVEAKRGPGGGYRLTRPPGAITVREIVEALEGKIAFVECQGGTCGKATACGSRGVWNTLQKRVGETLAGVSLAEIAEPTVSP